jgi:hypothetical protein
MIRLASLFIILFVFGFRLSAQSVLDVRVDVPAGNYSIESFLKKIEEAGVSLAYSLDMLPNQRIQVAPSVTTLRAALKILRDQASIHYRISDRLVILSFVRQGVTLTGTVRDADTGEALIGASVIVNSGQLGTQTNAYGFFSLTLPKNEYLISVSFVGYEPTQESVNLESNLEKNFHLKTATAKLRDIVISSKPPEYNVENMIPGITQVSMGENWPIPYFLGEVDIFQNALLLPGIRSVGEDATGINIRGGDIDQNLILLDEAPIYNPNHFYGLISVFNPEAVNSVEIMKGYMPPQYGGRASAVVNVVQKDGNNQEFHLSGGLGLVSSRLTAEGPIVKERSSYLVSARQSMLNISVTDFINKALDDNRTSFRDLNAKVNYTLNRNNRLYISGYYGEDRNRANFDFFRKWGNRSMSLRWNHLFGPRLFSNVTAIASEYTYQISSPQEVGSFIGKSNVVNYALKADLTYDINPTNTLDFGLQTTFHQLKPGERLPFDDNASTNPTVLDTEHGLESAIYLAHIVRPVSKVSFQYGARLSMLHNFGPENINQYQSGQPKSLETVVNVMEVGTGQVSNSFVGFEPRMAFNFQLSETQAFKAAYNRTFQYINLISNTASPSPTDIWKLSDYHIAPVIGDHVSLGYYRNLAAHTWETSAEVFFKTTRNAIDFKNGADLIFNENLETELLSGRTRAYGLELFLKRNTGTIRGWVSYTLSKAEQRFASNFEELTINEGSWFATDFDKRHDFSAVGVWSVSRRVSLSSSFNYQTGRPITMPVGKYILDGKVVPHFEERNQGRLNDYHRFDISVRINGREFRKKGTIRRNEDYWIFTIYNVYARRNVYSYLFRESQDNPGETEAVPYSIFGTAIPAITYHFKF